MKVSVIVLLLMSMCLVSFADNSVRINELNSEILTLQGNLERALQQKAQLEQGIAQGQIRLRELHAIKGELENQDKKVEKKGGQDDKGK